MKQQGAAPSAAAERHAKVFVSYSRKDWSFAQTLAAALIERGFDAFLDKTDIAPGEPWKERLAGLIAVADTIVFAVSPDSVASSICAWELEEGARLGKRLIPILIRRVSEAEAPATLARLNWVTCTESDDRDEALAALDAALRSDLPWVREHTRLGELARHWDGRGRGTGATLRGADLEAAEQWLDRRPVDANNPTSLHQAFIRASRRTATRRQRQWAGGSIAIAVAAISLAAFAEVSRREAQAQRLAAETARNEARTQRDRAQNSLALATKTANGLVFDLAQKFRDTLGVPAATIEDILARARNLQQQLSSAGETSPDLRHSQAVALGETSRTLMTRGKTRSALAAAKEAQGILEALVAREPSRTSWQRDLSVSHDFVGDALAAGGRLPEALEAYRVSLAMRERLARFEPGSARWQYDLSVSHDNIAEVLVAQGKLTEALKSYVASLEIRQRLAKLYPGDTGRQRELSVSYNKVGGMQVARNTLPEALKFYRVSLEIRQRLATSDPGNAGWQRDLSVAYGNVGDVLAAQGNLAEALKSCRAALEIQERLATSDPSNVGWQLDLAVAYGNVGGVLTSKGELAEALKLRRAGLDIQERLARADPGNVGLWSDLSASHSRVGDVLVAQGNRSEALTSYRASLAIFERLTASDHSNAEWQRNLIVSMVKIAETYPDEARTMLTRAKTIADRLRDEQRLALKDAWIPGELMRRLAALDKK